MRVVSWVLSLFMAATPHTVTLTWEDNLNPEGMLYSVYEGRGRCTQSPIMIKVAQDITVKTYTKDVAIGNYCYHVTASFEGIESLPSNQAVAEVRPWSPTNAIAR